MERVVVVHYESVACYNGVPLYRGLSSQPGWWLAGEAVDFQVMPAARAARFLQGELRLDYDPSRLGVVFGSSKGQVEDWHHWAQGQSGWPFPDVYAREYAQALNAQGLVLCPVAACATGAHAVALGGQLIQDGHADLVVVGANEPVQPELLMGAYRNMGALSRQGVIRPFDRRRDGFLPAAGGAYLLLASEEYALQNDLPVCGYLSGWSMKSDPTHMTAMCPSGDAIARAIEAAIKKAGQPEIGYINAHGTATKLNDLIETRAIQSVFGRCVPVSSTKPLTGHLLGAAGAIEAVLCLLALRDGLLPPTLNLEDPDEELDLDYISLEPRNADIQTALSLNYGFGGHIGALIFEKSGT